MKVNLVEAPHAKYPSIVDRNFFVLTQEFWLSAKIFGEQQTTHHKFSISRLAYPQYIVKLHVARKCGYYAWNVVFPLFFITLCGFGSMLVDSSHESHISEALSMTFTMLLTSVAFKFIISEKLPAVNYLSWVDIYTLGCFVVLVATAAFNVYCNLESLSLDEQKYYFYYSCGAWTGLHAFGAITIFFFNAFNFACEDEWRWWCNDSPDAAFDSPADAKLKQMGKRNSTEHSSAWVFRLAAIIRRLRCQSTIGRALAAPHSQPTARSGLLHADANASSGHEDAIELPAIYSGKQGAGGKGAV